jgi:hypothetical protein
VDFQDWLLDEKNKSDTSATIYVGAINRLRLLVSEDGLQDVDQVSRHYLSLSPSMQRQFRAAWNQYREWYVQMNSIDLPELDAKPGRTSEKQEIVAATKLKPLVPRNDFEDEPVVLTAEAIELYERMTEARLDRFQRETELIVARQRAQQEIELEFEKARAALQGPVAAKIEERREAGEVHGLLQTQRKTLSRLIAQAGLTIEEAVLTGLDQVNLLRYDHAEDCQVISIPAPPMGSVTLRVPGGIWARVSGAYTNRTVRSFGALFFDEKYDEQYDAKVKEDARRLAAETEARLRWEKDQGYVNGKKPWHRLSDTEKQMHMFDYEDSEKLLADGSIDSAWFQGLAVEREDEMPTSSWRRFVRSKPNMSADDVKAAYAATEDEE